VLFAACLRHAARQGRYRVLELVFAGLYGVLLEWLTIKQLEAYHYGQFLVMIDGAPLAIGLGWAVIIYSSMEFSERIDLPDSVRAILDALLALNIDTALDAVAIRLGMWTWSNVGPNQQWFGVPWVNFWAWFIVVWSYSGFVRALRGWRGYRVRGWLYVPLAVLLSLAFLLATSELYRTLINSLGNGALGPLILIGGSIVLILGGRPRVLNAGPPERLIVAIPMVFHGMAGAAGLWYGIYAQVPALAAVGVAMLVVGLAVHLWPWWSALYRPRSEAVGEDGS
jgi:hypothetical protein